MSNYMNTARARRVEALEKLAQRRQTAALGMDRPARRTHRSPLAQAIYAAEMENRARSALIH